MRQTKNYGWTLTLITALLSCGSSGEEAASTTPLLSQEGSAQGGMVGERSAQEPRVEEESDSKKPTPDALVVGEGDAQEESEAEGEPAQATSLRLRIPAVAGVVGAPVGVAASWNGKTAFPLVKCSTRKASKPWSEAGKPSRRPRKWSNGK